MGNFTSKYDGWVVANIDEFTDNYQGIIFFNPRDLTIPAVAVRFNTVDKNTEFTFSSINIASTDPHTGMICTWDSIKDLYSGYDMPNAVTISGHFADDEMQVKAITNHKSEILAVLNKSPFTTDSKIQGQSTSWDGFKSKVSTFVGRRYLFRGQNKPWKLRTAFHRRKRYNLSRFINEDIQTLHRYLTAKMKHVFNLSNPDENGAFFNLIQHHGYPTPLLDWTYSPYVAAFFAFKGIDKKTQQKEPVRIYVFNHSLWRNDWLQLNMLNTAKLHLSLLESLAIENDRAIPQQSVSTVTNIDDVETYIIESGKKRDKTYLEAIDINIDDRNLAMEELSYMGITSASMFPGLDGICDELRERFFTE